MFPHLLSKDSSAAPLPAPLTLSCRTAGWIGGAERQVEIWSVPPGVLMRVSGGSDFYIASLGETIMRVPQMRGDNEPDPALSELDHEILLGPALVLALALRGVWSLHASAARFAGNVFVFLGESGQGKSTLAAYLSASPNWRLVADDILPVKMDPDGVKVLPHFPQLKLPVDAQPGAGLPEHLPLHKLCVLMPARTDAMPQLHLLTNVSAAQSLLRHTAGTRLFTPELLGKHLSFCSLAAGQIPVYRLDYPHRKEMLPRVKELLEGLG
ncbi:MAG: hypothetical protein JW730_11555 [Anaerolineales bacterium]|nr:hypothetical protein [Anaerolineales bacterium]